VTKMTVMPRTMFQPAEQCTVTPLRPDLLSRLPVGSSARRMEGLLMSSARPRLATRCC